KTLPQRTHWSVRGLRAFLRNNGEAASRGVAHDRRVIGRANARTGKRAGKGHVARIIDYRVLERLDRRGAGKHITDLRHQHAPGKNPRAATPFSKEGDLTFFADRRHPKAGEGLARHSRHGVALFVKHRVWRWQRR